MKTTSFKTLKRLFHYEGTQVLQIQILIYIYIYFCLIFEHTMEILLTEC